MAYFLALSYKFEYTKFYYKYLDIYNIMSFNVDKLLLDLISKYKRDSAETKSNENIELEIRFKDLTKEAFENLFTSIKESNEFGKGILECSINTITSNISERTRLKEDNTQYIRQIIIDRGAKVKDSYVQKTRITKPIHFNDYIKYSVSLAKESPYRQFNVTNESLVRFKARVSFEYLGKKTEGAKWRFDLTAVKTGLLKDVGPRINDIKADLFPNDMTVDNFIGSLNTNLITSYEVEIEHIDKSHINSISLEDFSVAKKIFTLTNPSYMMDIAYQEEIYSVADNILCNRGNLHLYKSQYGLKKLGNQPIALTKSTYSEIFPPIGYYLTDKTDGIRCIVSVRGNRCRLLTDTLIEFTINEPQSDEITIADGELIYERGEKTTKSAGTKFTLYLFDCMVYKGENIKNDPFSKRVSYIDKAAALISKYTAGSKVLGKTFVQLEENRLEGGFREIYEDEFPYEIDGLILVEPSGNYCDLKQYKWKPMEMNSIDFIAVKCPQKLLGIKPYEVRNGHDLYLLFVGISYDMKEKLGLDFLPHYRSMFPQVGVEYFPIQFTPSIDPYAYLYYHPKDQQDIDHKPVELRKKPADKNGLKVLEWEFMRVREDRRLEKVYFGNDFRIAELTFMNFIDPFEFEDLWNPKFGYFTKTKVDMYNASNKYKRFVITLLLKDNFSGHEWVIDEGSGRGADLDRYQEFHIGNVLFIDVDRTAIAELIRRKFEFVAYKRQQRSKKHQTNDGKKLIEGGNIPMNSRTFTTYDQIHDRMYQKVIEKELHATTIHTLVMDLHNDYNKCIDSTHQFGLNQELVDGIVCNFALHYIACDTIEHMRNILKFNVRMLKIGGIFMFTVLNGVKVFELLKPLRTGQQWEVKENGVVKYAIKKLYSGDKLSNTGQKISVLLPLADEMYEEPLCNIDALIGEAQKLGFEVEVSISFGSKMAVFEKCAKPLHLILTDDDKKYIDLHQIVTLRKMKNVNF